MQFFIFVLIICFVIFLFSLFIFSHDDFILLRRNISTDQVFDYAISSGLSALLFSRIFYVIANPKPVFLNPLGFILFPYFPGLSLLGGIVGGALVILFLARRKGFPKGRILDLFALALLCSMPAGFIGFMLLSKNHGKLILSEFGVYFVLLLFCVFILSPKFLKSGKRDGIIGLIFLLIFSIVTLSSEYIWGGKSAVLSFETIFILGIFLSSIVLLINQIALKNILLKK